MDYNMNNMPMNNAPMNNMPTNNEPQPKKNSGLVLVLLLIIIGLVAFIFVKRDAIFNSNKDVKEEQKQEEKVPEPKQEEEQEPVEEEQQPEQKPEEQQPEQQEEKPQKGTLNTKKKQDKAEVTINGKKYVLEFKYTEDEGPGTNSLKLGSTSIYKEAALDGIGNVTYEVFKSAVDGKQYLFVSYVFWGKYGFIINDSGKIIKKVSEFVESAECYITPAEGEKTDLISLKDGYLYYFKYKGTDLDNKENIKIHEVKVSINNSKVTEQETGRAINGHPTNCV